MFTIEKDIMMNKPASFDFQPTLLSQINHALRTPLTGIMGMVHSLKNTPLSLEQERYLQIMGLSTEQLLGTINKLDSILKY